MVNAQNAALTIVKNKNFIRSGEGKSRIEAETLTLND